jgi:hypothetical protein
MSVERRGNPFGWILLGFVVGVLATFGTILFLTAGVGGYDQGPEETRTVADDAASEAMNLPVSTTPVPRKIEAPVAAAPTTPAIGSGTPGRSTPPVDSQMADDAAAAGMTSREQPTN